MPYSHAIATGSHLPKKVMTNRDLSKIVDTTDEWILSRSGIKTRHIAGKNEFTSHLATEAAKKAIKKAGWNPASIELLVVATTTPDRTFPSTAVKVQTAIGMSGGAAFDIQAACSGFIYGLRVVDQAIRSGQVKRACLIGADTLSKIVNWKDRSTCVLFGDGAGCVLFEAGEKRKGILSSCIASDGRFEDILKVDGGVGLNQQAGTIYMEGKEVFKHATKMMAQSTELVLAEADVKVSDIDYFVPHQANIRIINHVAAKLGIKEEAIVTTVRDHGNTSAASIPLALDTLDLKKGDILATPAVGGGLTWGSAIIEW